MIFKWSVIAIALSTTICYRKGPVRLGGNFHYTIAPPAPRGYGYASTCWYYLSHRQCFNQSLGIAIKFVWETFMFRWVTRTTFRMVHGWWLEPSSLGKQLLVTALASYLIGGFLTAQDAINGKATYKLDTSTWTLDWRRIMEQF
ncbi:hypothetical protein HYE68_000359 [Fusarium pseudograminearum]|nr:hypothetical protein HYE68_000359 [Fusarium pseudograminearum]